jgi:hypothetical protein
LFVITIALAGLLGIAIGGLTSLMLHRSWSLSAATTDGLLAAAVALVAAYIAAEIEVAWHVWTSNVTLALCLAVASVILKSLLRPRRDAR